MSFQNYNNNKKENQLVLQHPGMKVLHIGHNVSELNTLQLGRVMWIDEN